MRLTEEIRDRRVAVAKDVLVQLGRQDVPLQMSTSSGYINGCVPNWAVDLAGDLRDHVDTVQINCEVCAMGALLLSKARLADEVPMADVVSSPSYTSENTDIYIHRNDVCRLLEDTFDGDTLDRVEAFFEGAPTSIDPRNYYLEGIAAYVRSLPKPRDRMVEIAENIVRNRGEFVVPDEYEEVGPELYRDAGYGGEDDD